MNQTTHYQLSQWESTDRIRMEDFNSDNQKIDAAFKSIADAVTALQQAGYQVKTGSFAGSGSTGTRAYTLGVKPKLLVVQTSYNNGSYTHDKSILATSGFCIKFNTGGAAYIELPGNTCTLTADGFSLILNSTVNKGLDTSGSTLSYWVIY